MLRDVKTGKRYRNIKKGTIYLVVGFARHSETLETLVLYREVDDGLRVVVLARPQSLFMEKFEELSSTDD